MTLNFEWLVTDEEILAVIASPRDVPNCAIVWNTAPANACVLSGKMDVMTSAEMVNKTSTEIGDKNIAQKAEYQNGQLGLMSAISSGEPAHRRDVIMTR